MAVDAAKLERFMGKIVEDLGAAISAALVKSGVWMQITAGSLNGRFGEAAKYFGDKMSNDAKVLFGHLRKYRTQYRIGRHFLVKSPEEGLNSIDAAHPLI